MVIVSVGRAVYSGTHNGRQYRGIVERLSDGKYTATVQVEQNGVWFTERALSPPMDLMTERDAVQFIQDFWSTLQ